MRPFIAIALLIFLVPLHAQQAVIHVQAPGYAGKAITLYRYDDPFTLKLVRLDATALSDSGEGTLSGLVEGTAKLRLRIDEVHADLFARPGAEYRVSFNLPDARTARTLSGTARTSITFHGLDRLDVNALTSDLNGRLDAFIAEDLATDEVAGMQAVPIQRRDGARPDSSNRPPTLFVQPSFSRARIDSFELKVRRFYREVDDPWFAHYTNNSFGSMRHGPRVNEAELFNRYLKGQNVAYDDPEFTRFIRGFFSEHLLLAERFQGNRLRMAFAMKSADSLKAVLGANDFLKDDRLRELVAMDLLYQQYNGAVVVRPSADAMLRHWAEHSAYPEHRRIAANMLWDLTAMRAGERLPAMRLEDLRGREVLIDSLLSGPTCIAFTAAWCTYCDQEMQGLEQLHQEYGKIVPIIVIALDTDLDAVRRYTKAHPGMNFHWLHAIAEQQLRDDLRLRSIPAFYLLNDGVLARSPAPLPSKGLGAVLHQVKAEAEKGARVKVWDE